MYLSWKARKVGFKTKMVDLAAEVNRKVPGVIVRRAKRMLARSGRKNKNHKILIIGVTYKRDVNDLRESPSLDVIKLLKKEKVSLSYHDPYIPYLDIHGIKARSSKLTKDLLSGQDLVLLMTDHSDLDYEKIAENSKLIFDTRNIFEKKGIRAENIVKL